MKRLCAILMAGTLGAGAMAADVTSGAAGAAYMDSIEVRTETVPYEASEIRDEDAAEDLFFRIRRAAAEVCRISSFPRGYELWYEHDCEAEAVAEAVSDADVPVLEDYYEDLRGGSALPEQR